MPLVRSLLSLLLRKTVFVQGSVLTFTLVIDNPSKVADTKFGVMDTPWWDVDFAFAMMGIDFV